MSESEDNNNNANSTSNDAMDIDNNNNNNNNDRNVKHEEDTLTQEEPTNPEEKEEVDESESDRSNPDEDASSGSESDVLAPVTDSREISFKIHILNKYISCGLCNGYLREAYTINLCLHTFCKSCLADYINKAKKKEQRCPKPKCSTFLVTADPLRTEAKFDRALQNLVDKLLPQFSQAEEELKKEITGVKTEIDNSKQIEKLSLDKKRRELEATIPGELIAFELLPEVNSKLEPLILPIIKTTPKVTVRALRKYIAQKLKLVIDHDRDELVILCAGELLGTDHSLAFVKRTRWHEPNQHMVLTYKLAPQTL